MPLRPMMMPPVGKSGPLMQVHQLVQGGIGIVDEQQVHGIHHLAQVVGRDVGGHTHGNTGGAVHQKVGEPGWAEPRVPCRRSS